MEGRNRLLKPMKRSPLPAFEADKVTRESTHLGSLQALLYGASVSPHILEQAAKVFPEIISALGPAKTGDSPYLFLEKMNP